MRKNKFISLLLIMTFTFVGISNVNASSVSMKASSNTITRGNTATITTTINADSGIYTIEGSMSCKGAGVSGGIDLNYEDMDTESKSKSFTFTIKPTSSGTVTCTTSNVMLRELAKESNYSIGSKSITITVKDPVVVPPKQYSSNNNLSSLSIEGYEFDKSFSKDTLEYSVEVPNGTETVKINASASDKTASVKGIGEIEVSEGSNKLEVKVTAENGNVKTYVINVTVKELDPIEVTVGDKKYNIIRKEGVLEAPEGFEKTTVKIGEEDVLAYTNDVIGYTLVGLKDEEGNAKYYIYKDGNYTEYKVLSVRGMNLIVLDYPKDKVLDSFVSSELEIDGVKYNAYRSDDKSNYYLIYAKNIETGKDNLYQYDTAEGTIQIYNENNTLTNNKQDNDNYKLYFIITLVAFLTTIIATVITLIVKKKKSKRKVNTKFRSDINF